MSFFIIQSFIVLFASRWRYNDCLLHHVVTWTLLLSPAGPSLLSKLSLSPKNVHGKEHKCCVLAPNLHVLYGFCLFVWDNPSQRSSLSLSNQELLEIIANILGFIQNTLLQNHFLSVLPYFCGESNNSSCVRAQSSSTEIYGMPVWQALY